MGISCSGLDARTRRFFPARVTAGFAVRGIALATLCAARMGVLSFPDSAAATPGTTGTGQSPGAGPALDSAEVVTSPAEVRRTFDEVIVTATRVPTSIWRAPFAAHVVSRHSPQWALHRTSTDLLDEIPGVMAQKTSPGQGSPYLRGFTGFRNVHLVDGIRLNNSIFREGPNQYWNTIDPTSLERVEVVLGPGAVAYGSDAIGGSLNAITFSPPSSPEHAARNVSWRGATAERSMVGRATFTGGTSGFGIHAGLSGRRFGDLQGGRSIGRQPYTGYDEYGTDLKARYVLNRSSELVAALQYVRQLDVPRTHATVSARSFAGTTVGSDLKRELGQERMLAYMQFRGHDRDGLVESFRASASWQMQSEEEYRVRGDGSGRRQGVDVGTLGLWAQAEVPGPVGRWLIGVDHYHDVVNSFSTTSLIQGPVADDASYDLSGAFAQLSVPLGNTADLLVGERLTYAAARGNRIREPVSGDVVALHRHWHSMAGSVRVSWRTAGDAMLFGGLSQGFRAPNLSDLSRFDNARTNEFEVAALDLAPERTVTCEVGGRVSRASISGQIAWFRTLVRDQIVRRPTGRLIGSAFEVTRANSGSGYVTGVEAGLEVRTPPWSIAPRVAWQAGMLQQYPTSEVTETLEPASRLAPTTGALALRWEDHDRRIWAESSVTLVARQDRLSTADVFDTSRIPPGGTPGYVLISVRSRWRVYDGLAVTAAVENVANADYRVHGSGSNEPGRNFIVGTSLQW